jgi:hypothetical protein
MNAVHDADEPHPVVGLFDADNPGSSTFVRLVSSQRAPAGARTIQATAVPEADDCGFGLTLAQVAMRIGQRAMNGQPGGGSIGLGSSPLRMSFCRLRCASGSGRGIADKSAAV